MPWTATWAIGAAPAVTRRPLGLRARDRHHTRAERQEVVSLPHDVEADQPGHVLGARSGCDVAGASALDDESLVEDQHAVGQREGVDRVVGHQQADPVVRRQVARQLEPEAGGDSGVEPAERLVHEKQGRIAGQSPRDRDPLGLPARQLTEAVGRRGPRCRSVPATTWRRASAAARLIPRDRGPKAMLSEADRWGNSRPAWNTSPTRRSCTLSGGSVHDIPSTVTSPAAATSPARAASSVVLPAPLGPITATTSPGSAVKRTSRRPGTASRACSPLTDE